MRYRIGILLLALMPLCGQVTITYLANEGVMLTSGQSKILIDALFRDSLGDYMRHDAPIQEKLERGLAPFDGVGLALATHYHLDHWDAGAISRFLRLNRNARFASTGPATVMMPSEVKQQVRALAPDSEGSEELEIGGAHVESFALTHGGTPNLGFLITMGGRTLAHVGDADTSQANFDRLIRKKSPDVAMLPFWWLLQESGRDFVLRQWKPRHVVALHLSERDAKVQPEELRKIIPGVWIAIRRGEPRTY